MQCVRCQERMKCVDDVNTISIRLDFLACPVCGSRATITYGNNGEYVVKVEWERTKNIHHYEEGA